MQIPTSLSDRIAQLIAIRMGSNQPPVLTVSQDADRVARLLARYPLGGLVLFNGARGEEAAATLAGLQRNSQIPVLVAMDMETGSGQQLSDHVSWPHALAFEALGDEAAAAVEQFAFYAAQEAASVGVHVSFGPVLDIHRNFRNPIIATRAWGTNASRVIELAEAYVRGCRAGGLLCCGKHFPGHGSTTADSHAALPIVDDPADMLRKLDLVPFHRLVEQQIDMLMTAHVAYTGLDATGVPATLSRTILDDLLRHAWGYTGIVVSDSFKMEGIRRAADGWSHSHDMSLQPHKPEARLAIQAVRAGVDLLLDITNVEAVVEGLTRAAEADGLLQKRIEESCRRLWRVKVARFDNSWQPCHPGIEVAGGASARSQADEVAARAILCSGGGAWTTPWPSGTPVQAIVAHPYGDHGYTSTGTLVGLLTSNPAVHSLIVLGQEPTAEIARLADAAADDPHKAQLVVLLTKPDVWPEFGIPAWQFQLIQRLTARAATVVVSLGLPDMLAHYPLAALRLATFSDAAVSQRALVRRLLAG